MTDDDLLLYLAGSSLLPVTINAPAGISSFTVPSGVTKVDLDGEGQDGTPYVQGSWGYDTYRTETVTYADGSQNVYGPEWIGTTYDQEPPNNSCTMSGGAYPRSQICYTYEAFDNSDPGSIGSDSWGFDRVFPGGQYAPATPVKFSDVPVTPNNNYTVFVAPGGYLKITYWV